MSINRFRVLLVLGLMSAMGVGLFVAKIVFLHNWYMFGLNWNLFLAWIPVFIVLRLEKTDTYHHTPKAKVLFMSLLWLLFFPNAPYLITDFVHLYPTQGNLYWHHQIMFFCYAFVSLACGLLSLYWIQRVWTRAFSGWFSNLASVLAIALSGYGIFLGRIVRFNSWDFFVHPFRLSRYVLHSFHNPTAIVMTLEFSVFIGLAYCLFYSLIHLQDKAID